MKIINGNEFSKLAHFSLDFHLNKWELNKDLLENNAIIFCKTDYLNKLFNYLKKSTKSYILITHDSDTTINQKQFENRPSVIKKWLAANINYLHENLHNIPLGIENETVRHKSQSRVDYDWLRENLQRLRNKEKRDDVVYCNWNNNTYSERNNILSKLKKTGVNIIHDSGLSQYEYYERLANHQFVICPRGNGMDTHRLWETLCVGSIPITLKYTTHLNYNLPIIKLSSWKELNKYDLNSFSFRSGYNYYWLDMKNWETFIRNEYKKL